MKALRRKYLAAKSKITLNQAKPQSLLSRVELSEVGQKKTPEAYFVYMDNPIITFSPELSVQEKIAIRHTFCMCLANGKTSELESLSEESLSTIEYFSTLFPLSKPDSNEFSSFKIMEYLKSQHGILTSAGAITKYRPHITRYNELYPRAQLNEEILTEILAITLENITCNHYLILIILRGLSVTSKYKSYHVKYLFIIMFALIYQHHSNVTNIRRRWTDLKTDLPEFEGDLDPPSQREITDCWTIINHNLQLGTDLHALLDVVTQMVNSLSSDRLSDMMSFVPYSRMTVVKLITDAYIEYNDFPWVEMMNAYPVLKKELGMVMAYLDSIEEDNLAGFLAQSIGPQVPNLVYLSVHLHMEIGGKRTLRDYRGVGSSTNSTPVPLRNALEKMIEKYRSSQDTVLAYWPETAPERLDPKITDRMIRFGGGSGGGDGGDDDDGDDRPPHGGDAATRPDEHTTEPYPTVGPSAAPEPGTGGIPSGSSQKPPQPLQPTIAEEDVDMITDDQQGEEQTGIGAPTQTQDEPGPRTTRKTRATSDLHPDPSSKRPAKQKAKDSAQGESKSKKVRRPYRSRDGKNVFVDLSQEDHDDLLTFLRADLLPTDTERTLAMNQFFPDGPPHWLQEVVTKLNLISAVQE